MERAGQGRGGRRALLPGLQRGGLSAGVVGGEHRGSGGERGEVRSGDGGDMFYVPAGNIYRIENHSRVVDAMLYWTIIRPSGKG